MITVQAIQLAFAVLYGLVAVGLAGMITRVPEKLKRYAAVFVVVVVVTGLDLVAQLFGVGSIAIGGDSLGVSTLVSQTVQYIALYGAVVRLGGGSRRLTAMTILIALFPSYVTEIGALLGGEALVLVFVTVGFVLPLPVLLFFFFGRLKRSAAGLPPRRRLLYWKARNLILFVYAMVLVYIGLLLFGVLTDQVLSQLLLRYAGFVFSAGLPAFFVYKFTGFDEESASLLFDTGSDETRSSQRDTIGSAAD